MLTVAALTAADAIANLDDLTGLLRNVVDDGAAIGFMPPLAAEEACTYWRGIAADLANGPRVLLVAHSDGVLVGSVQLDPAMRPNGLHRAEVQKLMVHTVARRQGVGRALINAVEEAARELGRTLLVLDTRQDDAGESLYRSLGYIEAGSIPNYARSANGELHATVLFYKIL